MIPHEVAHRCPVAPQPLPSDPRARYRGTGNGDTCIPSFGSNSTVIRSSPQLGLSRAMATISRCNSAGRRGRPGRDRQRRKRRQAPRCHRSNVAGGSIVSASRQAKQRASSTSPRRIGPDARRGRSCRSRDRANCLRRSRFSAANAVRDRRLTTRNRPRDPFQAWSSPGEDGETAHAIA